MTWKEKLKAAFALNPEETPWWMFHPNRGWVQCDCPCEAVDVSSMLRQLGDTPWPISLGGPYLEKQND